MCVASKLRPCHIEPGLVPTDTVVPADGEVLGWSKPETMQLLASPLRRSFCAAKLHPRTVFGSLGAPGNSILGKVAEENASPAGVAALVLNTCSS